MYHVDTVRDQKPNLQFSCETQVSTRNRYLEITGKLFTIALPLENETIRHLEPWLQDFAGKCEFLQVSQKPDQLFDPILLRISSALAPREWMENHVLNIARALGEYARLQSVLLRTKYQLSSTSG